MNNKTKEAKTIEKFVTKKDIKIICGNELAEQHLKAFFIYINSYGALMDKAKQFLCLTEQNDIKYVGGGLAVDNGINLLRNILTSVTEIKIKQKINTNLVQKQCEITFKRPTDNILFECSLVKEKDIKTPCEKTGQWGIIMRSFQNVKNFNKKS